MAGMSAPTPSFGYRAGQLALRWSLVIALFVAWELLTRTRTFTPFMLPSPQSVLERIWRDGNSGDLFINMALTIYRALAGFLIAAVLGVSIGLVMTSISWCPAGTSAAARARTAPARPDRALR